MVQRASVQQHTVEHRHVYGFVSRQVYNSIQITKVLRVTEHAQTVCTRPFSSPQRPGNEAILGPAQRGVPWNPRNPTKSATEFSSSNCPHYHSQFRNQIASYYFIVLFTQIYHTTSLLPIQIVIQSLSVRPL